jgi:hypothetical protein
LGLGSLLFVLPGPLSFLPGLAHGRAPHRPPAHALPCLLTVARLHWDWLLPVPSLSPRSSACVTGPLFFPPLHVVNRAPPPSIYSPRCHPPSPLYRPRVTATVPLSPHANPLTKGSHHTPPHPHRPPVRAGRWTTVPLARFQTPTATIAASKVRSNVPSV